MTWIDLGKNSRSAAQMLKEHHARSCVSRSYYAAFSVVNAKLLPHQTPPTRYETHRHQQIPGLVEKHLLGKNRETRRELRAAIVRLYNARLDADYRLSRTVGRAVALGALRDARSIFNILGVDRA